MKLIKKLHLWLSVPFGIFITLVCFSGSMLVFEQEITRALRADVYYTGETASSQSLGLGKLMETVQSTLPDSVSVTGVTVFSDPSRTYQVNLSKPARSAVYINQYTGMVTGSNERIAFFDTMFKLHRWLLDSANPHGNGVKIGKLLVGISTIIFVVALITGIVLWIPRVRKKPRKFLTISFAKGWKGFWKGLHVAGGVYVTLFVLAMALTGLTWSFQWYRNAFYAVCGVEQTSGSRHGGQHGADKGKREHGGDSKTNVETREAFAGWDMALQQLQATNPDARQITISGQTATVTLNSTGNVRAADSYAFNPRSHRLELSKAYSEASGADCIRGWIYSVHTGGFGGVFTHIIWFISALLGATLPLTGYYIWILHLRKKKENPHK